MKKFIALVLAAVMALSVAGCAAKPAEEQDRLAKIKAAGKLTVCTEPYFAPYEFVDPNKEGQEANVGYDMEIAKHIADEIGVELEIVPLEFSAVLAGIAEGKYDLAISAIAYSPERAETLNMSQGYKTGEEGYGFCCRIGEEDKYTSIESLKDAVIITQSGSVEEALIKDQVSEYKELKLVASMTDAYVAVAEGKADVAIISVSSAKLYADANGTIAVPDFEFDDPKGYNTTRICATKEGTDSLIELCNGCIDELKADGSLDKWWNEAVDYAASLGL